MNRSDNAAKVITSRRKMLLAAGVLPVLGLAPTLSADASSAPKPFVPVPKRAQGPQIPPKGYVLDHLGEGLYGVRDGGYQSAFLVTRSGVVVVDAPSSFGEKLMAAVREVTHRKVTHLVYSHSHVDHIGAAHLFPGRPAVVAHSLTSDQLRQARDPRRPIPTQTFSGRRHVLAVGGEKLVLEYRGALHQAGNLFIHAPHQRMLMLVDVIAPRWAPFFRLDLAPDVRAFTGAAKQVLRYDFETFIGGHVGRFGTRADVEDHARYIADLRAAATQALSSVDFAESTKGVPRDNAYAQFKAYTDALSDRCVELMPTSWLSRVGGADVFLRDNASAYVFSLLID